MTTPFLALHPKTLRTTIIKEKRIEGGKEGGRETGREEERKALYAHCLEFISDLCCCSLSYAEKREGRRGNKENIEVASVLSQIKSTKCMKFVQGTYLLIFIFVLKVNNSMIMTSFQMPLRFQTGLDCIFRAQDINKNVDIN